MRVLIVGGSNRVTNALIEKLSKEKAKIYVLTGGKKKGNKYHNIYEKYNFEYDNPCIKEILESVDPDVTVFTGAFDSNFNWQNGYDEVVRYVNAVNNICAAFSLRGHGRLIYMSSDDVTGVTMDEYREIVDRERVVTQAVAEKYSYAYKGIAVRTGENLIKNMAQNDTVDMLAIRVEKLCFEPDSLEEATDVCSRMCIEAINYNSITIMDETSEPLYINDFVEFLYRAMVRESFNNSFYRMNSDSSIKQMEIAQIVDSALNLETNKNINVVDVTLNVKQKEEIIPSISEEMGMKVFKDAKESVTAIASHIASNVDKYQKKNETLNNHFIWNRIKRIFMILLPFIENIIVFIPFFMINNRVTGSMYFAKLDCYLLYVLLFAIVYGQQQASFSAILAVCGYVFREMYSRTGFDIVLDYNTYVWIAQLVILGLSVGYLRDKINLIKDDKTDESVYLGSRLKDIELINKTNARIKDELETQVVNQSDSLGKIFEITSKLDSDAPEEVYFHSADIISDIMGCRDVAIYNVSNKNYARLMAVTSDKAKQLGNSIEYTKYEEMYSEFKEGNVYINKKLNKEYPMMAVAIANDDEMKSIILLWDIAWDKMNLSYSNRLRVVSYLIQNAVVRANKYMDVLETQRYIDNTKVLEEAAFRTLVEAYVNARAKSLADCTIIKINTKNGESVVDTWLNLQKLFRVSDYMGTLADNNLYVLLANTNGDDAGFVTKRIEEADYTFEIIDAL